MGIFQRGFKRDAAQGHEFNLHLPKLEQNFTKTTVSPPSPSSPKDVPSLDAQLAQGGSQSQPIVSPAFEEVPIWNILPSYQLYESTFSKVMDPTLDFDGEPPLYEDSPPHTNSCDHGNDYFGSHTNAQGSGSNLRTPEPRWENSIIANVHRMKHVDEFNKLVADKLKIDVYLTKQPGAKGRKPQLYNAQEMEFSQGDPIHGYVVVVNTCHESLSFDMFSVMFEGRVSVNSNETGSGAKPLLFYKFLNMFDYNASWTPVNFEQSSPDISDCIDPVDGTRLQFPFKRKLEPGVAYKKFFNFTVPVKLLDCACEPHEIPKHCMLFPSIGLDKNVFLQRLRKLREPPTKPERAPLSSTPNSKSGLPLMSSANKKRAPNFITRDAGFPDTSISYSVETKVIGKRSVYEKQGHCKNDEFVIVKEMSVPLRVIPRELHDVEDDAFIAEKHYDSLVRDVQKCIDTGRRLEEGEEPVKLSRKLSTAKQVYDPKSGARMKASSNEYYAVHFPYKRKHLTQPAKLVGLLNANVSRHEHVVRYVTPYIFTPVTDFDTDKLAKIKFGIDLEYICTEGDVKGVKPPDIRAITAKIVICSVRSKKYPIPIEITQDLKFRNTLGTNDTIEKYLVAPFKSRLDELSKLISIYGTHVLGISKQLLMDIKSLANLEYKSTILKVDTVHVHTKGGLGQWSEYPQEKRAEKLLEIDVDIQSLFVKDSKRPTEDKISGALTLVPSFQSCIMCRYYYLLLEIKLGNGDTMPVKVPFRIAK